MSTLKKLILVAASTPCYAFTYWVDKSCGDNSVDIPTIFTDVQAMASAGGKGVTDSSPRYDFYYNQLFKETRGQSPITQNTLSTFFKNIGEIQATSDRASSNIRIYCGSEDRFSVKQSDGSFLDPLNRVIKPVGTNGCDDDGTEAETYPKMTDEASGEAVPRATISICKATFGYKRTNKDYLSWLDDSLNSAGQPTGDSNEIDQVRKTNSRVLFHEFTHFSGMGTDEIKYTSGSGGKGEAMEWYDFGMDNGLLSLDKDGAIRNAESYTVFAQLCQALSLGWVLTEDNVKFGELSKVA